MSFKDMKKKTVHRVVMEDDVVISDETFEITDWEAYWIFDLDAQPKESIMGFTYYYDKSEYPRMEDAQNACKVEIYERKMQQANEAAARAEGERQARAQRAAERKAARERAGEGI